MHSQAWFDEYLTTVLLVQNVSLGVGTLKSSRVSVEVKSVFKKNLIYILTSITIK